jgi:hypothetical protein
MSLINDALRRAKDAQQQTPATPSADLPFRPVEPSQQGATRGLGLVLPVALATVALLTVLSSWQWVQKRDSTGVTQVYARTADVARTTPAIQPATAPAAADTAVPGSSTRPYTAVQPDFLPARATDTAAALAADATSATTNAPLADVQEGEVTNAAASAPPSPPKPAPLRLQAIIFSPRRPSAMISGKTLFVGDKLGELRVVAIDKESATLAGAGQTNVLSLPE